MKPARLVPAIAFTVIVTGTSQAQITVDLPLPPPPDREVVLAGITGDPSSDPKMLHYLLDYDLCTRVEPDGSQMVTATDADGETYSPVFTTKERVREVFGNDAMPLCATGRFMLGGMRGKRVVFDPTGPHSVTWPPQELRRILAAEYVAQPGTVAVTVPVSLPKELVARLTQLFQSIPQVESASITICSLSRREPSFWRLEIHAGSDLDKAELDAKVRRAIEGIDMSDLALLVVIAPASDFGGIGRQVYAR